MRARLFILATAVLLFGLSHKTVHGQTESPRITKDVEAAALAFAKTHHPELAELLRRLKAADRAAYGKAVADVAQAHERLSRLKENDAERYRLSLEIWTLDSRIRLLAARMTMADDPGLEAEIRELLKARQRARLALLRFDHEKLSARIERLNTQINQLEGDSDAALENDFARIQRGIKASSNRERRMNRRTDSVSSGAKQPVKPPARPDR